MQELIKGLMIWALTLTGYGDPGSLPGFEAVPHKQLVKRLCEGQHCAAVAYYDTTEQVIYFDRRMKLETDQHARGYLLHELVHFLQHMNGHPPATELNCEERVALELEAYRVQQLFLREHHINTYQIDLAVTVLSEVCELQVNEQ